MSTFESSVPQLLKMLNNLDRWLDAAVEYAKTKSFDPEVLLAMRLAPDQFPLGRQIQSACDSAKFIPARLTGVTAPAHPDTEKTLPEYRARIKTCMAYLETFEPKAFEGAAERHISLPWMEGKWLFGRDYLNEFALPNFYFHVTTAYAILRHAGVPLGKMTYIGSVNMQDQAAS